MEPYASEDSVLAYLMPLGYRHVSEFEADDYYAKLVQLADVMDNTIWCEMFMGECLIPFQALDHEELRAEFCERCLDKNSFIQELFGRSTSEKELPESSD